MADVPPPAPAPPRVCVDLNVFVAAERALRRPRRGGLPERIVEAIEAREIVLVASLNMFERLEERLQDAAELSPEEARFVIARYASLAHPLGLVTRRSPIIALGTGPHADEDARVVEAALAGKAEYLVTYNVDDFLPAVVPSPLTGHPEILGVRLLRPSDLAQRMGWPLSVVPPPLGKPSS